MGPTAPSRPLGSLAKSLAGSVMTRMIRAGMGEPREDTQTYLEWGSERASWMMVIVLRLTGYVMVWPDERMGVKEQVGAGRGLRSCWTRACLGRAPVQGQTHSMNLENHSFIPEVFLPQLRGQEAGSACAPQPCLFPLWACHVLSVCLGVLICKTGSSGED